MTDLRNKRMQEMVARGSAIDLKDCKKVLDGKYYLIEDKFAIHCLENDIEKDYCDTSKEAWVWSIGRVINDSLDIKGSIVASLDGGLYQNPHFHCLWLR